jgi:glycosyltransferase involved in cell wall biosynthesis
MSPRILYLVSEDWYFLSHRLPMARAARAAGFEVHVACNVVDGSAAIAREGFILHPIPFARGKLSPLSALRTVLAVRGLHARLRPSICHHVSLQPSVLGSLGAIGSRAGRVNALTGLGFIFSSDKPVARLARPLIQLLLRWLLGHPRAVALVQNPDDRALLKRLGLSDDKITMIQGSGVDTDVLRPTPEPAPPVTVTFVGRLLIDKGVRTLVEAFRLVTARIPDARLLIAGSPDTANPASISQSEAESWNNERGVTWLGHTSDIAGLWQRSHIAVLPSFREGLPLSLLEAAACGRAMVATDVPGCREIAVHDETGLLVPANDPAALADAMVSLVQSRELRERYAAAARKRVEDRFSARAIGAEITALYRSLLDPADRAALKASPQDHA